MALGKIPETVRMKLYDLTGGLCEYCGQPAVDLDHYPRRSQPGAKNDTNHLLALCRRCHMWSGNIRSARHEYQYQQFLTWKRQLPLHHLDDIRRQY